MLRTAAASTSASSTTTSTAAAAVTSCCHSSNKKAITALRNTCSSNCIVTQEQEQYSFYNSLHRLFVPNYFYPTSPSSSPSTIAPALATTGCNLLSLQDISNKNSNNDTDSNGNTKNSKHARHRRKRSSSSVSSVSLRHHPNQHPKSDFRRVATATTVSTCRIQQYLEHQPHYLLLPENGGVRGFSSSSSIIVAGTWRKKNSIHHHRLANPTSLYHPYNLLYHYNWITTAIAAPLHPSLSSINMKNTNRNNNINSSLLLRRRGYNSILYGDSTGSSRNYFTAAAQFLVLLTAAVVLSFQPVPLLLCYAESNSKENKNNNNPIWSRLFSSSSNNKPNENMNKNVPQSSNNNHPNNNNKNDNDDENANRQPKGGERKYLHNNKNCPYFGCVMRPIDIHYNNDAVMAKALEQLRSEKRTALLSSDAIHYLSNRFIATSDAVTLTLIGYKGGTMQEQINQDRSIIISPYTIVQQPQSSSEKSSTLGTLESTTTTTADEHSTDASVKKNAFLSCNRTLLGVFDGHAPLGELVSEYTATTLPSLLASKLYDKAVAAAAIIGDDVTSSNHNQTEISITIEALEESFVELDKTAPADESGGCTATVVLHQGKYVYIANAGDSRSFIITYRPSTNTSRVIAISREDKPSLPDERARVEQMGGQVYIPIRGTSRVVYHDPTTGAPTGLAMSRSIGDWEAGKLGVIPNPLIQVLNIDDIVQEQIRNDTTTSKSNSTAAATSPKSTATVEVEATGEIGKTTTTVFGSTTNNNNDDVYIFAVCATDGMMDFVNATEIARVLGHALYADDGAHPVAAIEHLILSAASLWHHSKQGRYRDDIAIAVSTLRTPPNVSNKIFSKL